MKMVMSEEGKLPCCEIVSHFTFMTDSPFAVVSHLCWMVEEAQLAAHIPASRLVLQFVYLHRCCCFRFVVVLIPDQSPERPGPAPPFRSVTL